MKIKQLLLWETKKILITFYFRIRISGGGQYLQQPNVERLIPIFIIIFIFFKIISTLKLYDNFEN